MRARDWLLAVVGLEQCAWITGTERAMTNTVSRCVTLACDAQFSHFNFWSEIMITRGLIFAGLAGALLALLTTAGRSRNARLEKHQRKKEISRWEDEGGNLRPERVDRPRRETSHPIQGAHHG